MITDPDAICQCGHELKWHNSCSQCYCAFFLPATEKDRGLKRAWYQASAARHAREKGEDA